MNDHPQEGSDRRRMRCAVCTYGIVAAPPFPACPMCGPGAPTSLAGITYSDITCAIGAAGV